MLPPPLRLLGLTLIPSGVATPQHEGAWRPYTWHMIPLLPHPAWPEPRGHGLGGKGSGLLQLSSSFLEKRSLQSPGSGTPEGPARWPSCPPPYLLGTPTLPGVVVEGLVFQIQRQNIRCLDSESHFLSILMDYKDLRAGQEVPTWKVT